ncbi:MAG: type IV secretion system DNA-binding domain-containing protein [Treponema sp.]|jgi:energy-coupling factor transporter ATP-binding protein EcfA2|nr:type IV secretion system DNA-binding domain-containing protein [Treponema sp.]
MKRNNELVWRKADWRRPFELGDVINALTHLAATHPHGAVIWETRAGGDGVKYLLGAEKYYHRVIEGVFKAHGDVRFTRGPERPPADFACRLNVSHKVLSLKTELTPALLRAALAAMLEGCAVQIVFGPSFAPRSTPDKLPDPNASWLDTLTGNVRPASAETQKSAREKHGFHGFSCVIRLGGSENGVRGLFNAFKMLESVGVRLSGTNEAPDKLNAAHVPWHFPLRLSVKELANFMLLPVGEDELPKVSALHPRIILPPPSYKPRLLTHNRCFAEAANGAKLGVTAADSLEHTVILGPTGSGKSTVMLNLITADINAGRGVLVIDPKNDLVNEVLRRIPEARDEDTVILDPSDPCPAGFNPFCLNRGNPELTADIILNVFKEIFSDSWGVRTQDILTGALLTLAKTPNATLSMLPVLLTDNAFRRKITERIDDRLGLEPFWAGYEAMSGAQRDQVIAPVLNKLRQFLMRPALRNVLGQDAPKFAPSDLFRKRKIVLVPLNKGVIGAETARLLGSLIVGMTWALALQRVHEPPERRYITHMYIDELQNYLSLPTDLSDALAQARGLGLGLTLAHQYRDQLSPAIRAGVDANARNKIVFGLNAKDARDTATESPGLEAADFMALPRYHVYARIGASGGSKNWIYGKALSPAPPTRDAAELRARSMTLYGQSAEITERRQSELLGYDGRSGAGSGDARTSAGGHAEPLVEPPVSAPVGRKKRNG